MRKTLLTGIFIATGFFLLIERSGNAMNQSDIIQNASSSTQINPTIIAPSLSDPFNDPLYTCWLSRLRHILKRSIKIVIFLAPREWDIIYQLFSYLFMIEKPYATMSCQMKNILFYIYNVLSSIEPVWLTDDENSLIVGLTNNTYQGSTACAIKYLMIINEKLITQLKINRCKKKLHGKRKPKTSALPHKIYCVTKLVPSSTASQGN